jgi:hypothetical protein
MGFTKLDEGILQSSVVREDGNTFKVWIILLAACKEDGVARVSPVFISSIGGIKIEKVMASLKKLESPDPLSRSTNNDGRRIERVNGGFCIINYHKYRNFTYSGSKEAVKKRKQRERNINVLGDRKGTNKGRVPKNKGHSASASASSSASASEKPSHTRLIEYWQLCKATVTHRTLTSKMEATAKRVIAEHGLKEAACAVRNYNFMMESGKDFYGKYTHGFDDFFRAGDKKPAPFVKFLDERKPLKNLWKNKADAKEDDFDGGWIGIAG